MKPVLIAATALLLGLTRLAFAENAPIRIATEGAYPPFNFMQPDGSVAGLDVDMANALCAQMKARCTIVTQDWDGMIPALMAGKFDAVVASMSITEERRKQVDFTDKYYTTPLAVTVPKDSAIAGVAATDMAGKAVGAQAGTTQASYAEDVYTKGGADVRIYPTQDEAAADLQNGRVDALISDKFVVVDWLGKAGADCCRLLGDVPGTETEAGIALRKGDDALRERFNAAIKAIVADGTHRRIVAKYFPFDIY
ncbi:ABC transporter substrate-binding protein [Aureimonas sp. AU4]|uniref:ABC transporter substrate-binding protein n=1 Tax=Aureimonas sp. AU4 TaxID=1638163 RepID=UPI0007864232|nr:ABC transporter substrate-binding protein [Aureimonas sp. AU4]